MCDKKKLRVFGYSAETDPLWNLKGKFIGSVDDIEDARKLKNSALSTGFGIVRIYDGDFELE